MKDLQSGSDTIQSLVDAAAQSGRRCAYVSGRYEIDKAIRLPSHFTIILENCYLRLAGEIDNLVIYGIECAEGTLMFEEQ